MPDETLPAILDTLSEAIVVLDGQRRILLANGAARDLFGNPLVGHDFVRAIRQPDCLACVDSVLAGAPEAEVMLTLPRPAPTMYRVNVVGLDTEGEARAVVSVYDISQIRNAEKMRRDFVANVSHELRSPLTALSGFIETLKGAAKNDPDARQHFLKVMENEALRMKRLIDDLLSLSKVEINARVRPTERIVVSEIVQRVITTLSLQARERGKTVKLDVPDDNPAVLGDADELTQVFQNLIENAIKYSAPESDVVVSISVVPSVVGVLGSALCIAIQDQGPGIPRAHIPRLTERFYRVDGGRARDEGGTGLGLAIVKHIVGRHRGRLLIKSEVGVGSTFTVFLPIDGGFA